MRNIHLNLAGDDAIAALVRFLVRVPESCLPFAPLVRVGGSAHVGHALQVGVRLLRHDDFAVLNASLARVVEHLPGALIGDADASAIGSRSGRALPFAARQTFLMSASALLQHH